MVVFIKIVYNLDLYYVISLFHLYEIGHFVMDYLYELNSANTIKYNFMTYTVYTEL